MSTADDLFGLIRERRSVRRFRDEPVGRATLERLVELASWAPSAGNRQDWLFTVVTSPKTRSEMAAAVRRRWEEILAESRESGVVEEAARYVSRYSDISGVPVVILVSARGVDAVQRRMLGEGADLAGGGFTSAAMAAQNLMLAAHALGLGSCCMTGPLAAGEELHRIAGLDRRQRIVCLVVLGQPTEIPPAPKRKPVPEIVRFLE